MSKNSRKPNTHSCNSENASALRAPPAALQEEVTDKASATVSPTESTSNRCTKGLAAPTSTSPRQDGSRVYSDPFVEFRVQPRPVPCSLPIVLGSSSPHRRAVMEALGWQFSSASPDIDEKAIRDPDPRKMCAEIARAKARALVERLDGPAIVITADQVCLFDQGEGGGERVREKPESVQEAKAFLRSYSGRSVKTLSALLVTNLETGQAVEGVHESTVSWREIPSDVVDAVVARGLTMSAAGGFALEDPDLRSLVDNIEGSLDSIVGLPVDLLCDLVERAAA